MLNKLHSYLKKVSLFIFQDKTPDQPDQTEQLPVTPPDAQRMPTSPNDQPEQAAAKAAEMIGGSTQNAQKMGTEEGKVDVTQHEPISAEELARMSKGYPEVTERGSKETSLINRMLEQIKARPTSKGKVEHRDTQSITENGREYVLVYDTDNKPNARLFRQTESNKEELDDVSGNVDSYLKSPYTELQRGNAEFTKYAAMMKGEVANHGDMSERTAYNANDVPTQRWVLLKDDKTTGGYRVFKGTPKA